MAEMAELAQSGPSGPNGRSGRNGRKKKVAVIIEINYSNQNAELNGCIDDDYKLRGFISYQFWF